MIYAGPVSRTLHRVGRIVPESARRAGLILEHVFERLHASQWPEVVEQFSSLTNTGFPVEFAWTSKSPSLRFTCEVASPETAERDRLPIALDMLSGFGAGAFESKSILRNLAEGAPLKFGAWIGVRCFEAGESFKLYSEMPDNPAGKALAQGFFESARLRFRATHLRWRMAGLAQEGGVELYARAEHFDVGSLRALVAELDADADAVVESVTQIARQNDLPDVTGLSFAFDKKGFFSGLTVFAFAKHIHASDERTREALMASADADPTCAALYKALCGGTADGRWRHGMIGVGVARGGARWVQAGIRPT